MEGDTRVPTFAPKLQLLFLLLLICCCVLTGQTKGVKPTKGHPVILIPGDGGTQLWASINKSSTVHFFCRQKEDMFVLWLNLEELLPDIIDCFVDNARLVYDNKTRTTSGPPGVNVTIVDFGNTSSVEYLDPSHISVSYYFNGIVSALLAVGYERGLSVRGAPYDFRKSPNEAQVFYRNLTRLIEETYRLNQNRKVVILSHSLGGMYTLYFLNRQSVAWKAKYIQAFVPISGPWGGATKSARILMSGDSVGDFTISAIDVRKAQRSWTSLYLLLPTDKFWGPEEVLIQTPLRNYTVKDYAALMNDIKYNVGIEILKDVQDLVYDLKPPGVPVYGIHGRDVKTEEQYVYDSTHVFPDDQPLISYGQGDGTVNMRSLKGYMKWQEEQSFPVSEFEISGAEHLAILQNTTLFNYIIKTVLHLP